MNVDSATSKPEDGMPPTVAAGGESGLLLERWRGRSPQVRKALEFIRARGSVTAAELVDWDLTQPPALRLFTWDDALAATAYRLAQARNFLNHFKAKFDGMRVRAFIHVTEDADLGIERDEYVTAEAVSQHEGMRAQVIADITKRMRTLASELRMWNLGADERARIMSELEAAMSQTTQ